jgi:hypothetical protein
MPKEVTNMKLMTKEILNKLPKIGATEKLADDQKRVFVKYFNPCGAGTWYGLEFDPVERTFFGYANITDGEFGYFSLDELESVKGPFGLGIERDLHWDDKTTIADVLAGKAR